MSWNKKQRIVSIVIPVYNRGKFIEKTLASLVKVNYRPLEVVVVDDGSTDNSLDVVQKFKEDYENDDFLIKIISQSNYGAPVARNVWLSESRGDYIQFLDSDDFIHEDKIQLQIQLLENSNADFCVSDFTMRFTQTGNVKYHSNQKKVLKIIFPSLSFGCWSALISRSLAMKLDWNMNLHRNQDMDYFLRAALIANKVVHIKKALYYYSMHNEDRISDNYTTSNPVFYKRIKWLIKTKVNKKNIPLKYIAILFLGIKLIRWHIWKIIKKIWKKLS